MVRLVLYNIEYEEGLVGHWYDYLKIWRIFSQSPKLNQKLINFLKKLKLDIIALIEVDKGSFRTRFKDMPQFIEHQLDFTSLVDWIKYPFVSYLRLFHFIPILSKQCNALMSKYKLYGIKHHMFKEGTKRVVIEASVNCPKKVTLLVAHLALGAKTRAKQIKELAKIVNCIKNEVILMGDFNTFHGIHELDYLFKKTNLKDCAQLDYSKIKYTEPTWHPSKRLDYVLVSKGINIKDYEILKANFSDHLPVLVEFQVK